MVKTQIPFWFQVRQSSQLVWSFLIKTTTQEDNYAWEYAFAIMKFLTSLQQSVLMSAGQPQFSQAKAQAKSFCTLK